MIFQTRRLIVRELQTIDFAPFHEMQSDDEVMRYTTEHGSGKGLSDSRNRKQFEHCIESYQHADNRFRVWAIVDQQGSFVGTCAVIGNENDETEIGYRILRRLWGKGFATEIATGLVDYCLNHLEVGCLFARTDVRNIASVRILDSSRLKFIRQATNEHGMTDRYYELRSS